MTHAIINAKTLLQKYDIIKILKTRKTIIFLFLCLIISMIAGSVSVSSLNMDYIYKLNFLFLSDFKEKLSQSNLQVFSSSLAMLGSFAILLELSAFSCLGTFFIPLIISFKGFSLGLTAGYLYLIYGLKGIAFYILILLPGIFVSSVAVTFFAANCMKFSFKLAKTVLAKETEESIKESLKKHLRKSGYCLIVLVMSSGLDVCFMMMFSRFFNF